MAFTYQMLVLPCAASYSGWLRFSCMIFHGEARLKVTRHMKAGEKADK